MLVVPPWLTIEGLAEQLRVGGSDALVTVTPVAVEAVLPWSSATLQVTVILPAAAPLVFKVAVLPLPEIEPEEVLQV
jgi:hypothetical protein